MKRNHSISMGMSAVVIMGFCGTLFATQTSDRIESSAKNSYVFKTHLKGDDIKIKVSNDSIVTLTGTVSEWSHRSLAEETVAGIAGVKRIDNKLEAKGGQPAETSDAWIGMKVKTTLMFHRNVSGLNTEVAVKEGVVTLRGKASSEAQKELATEYARDVEGVKNVTNDMAVEKAGKTAVEKIGDFIDDASITSQVKLALLFHRSTSAVKTKVETKDGTVTVTGVAKNAAEKELVSKLVGDINGAKAVKNEMTVEKVSGK
ncbi:MAG: BON domain-containing protein [Chitinispirillaceae bacterium]|nr:BON domain-containing protein [Chitinispirillaceae bacterium]